MTRSVGLSLAVCLAAGSSVALGDEPLVALEPTIGKVVDVAHIYFNLATGEKVVTLLHDQVNSGDVVISDPIWSSMVLPPCGGQPGFTTSFYFALDDNTPDSNGDVTSLATAATLLDYGDIPIDSVVDMVHVDWVVGHPDTDTDSDSIGDGVVGLAGLWTYWDMDNGRAIDCARLPIIAFTLYDLPGNIADEGFLSGYTVDIDLAGSFSSSLTFEIGDSDGDSQGAAVSNSDVDTDSDGIGDGVPVAHPNIDRNFDGVSDSDLDGDGLFDWSWTVRFFQPGTDSDGDGIADGDPADSMHPIGVSFGAPEGEAIDNGDGTWTWLIDTDTFDAGTGQEDRFAMYGPPDLNGDILYAGGFWFGGFSCEDNGSGGYTPLGMFRQQLIGPRDVACCPSDFNCDDVSNFFDISAFLAAFSAMEPVADINGDDAYNFFDISEYLAAFAAGCP